MRIIGYRESAESAKQTRLQTCQSNRDAQYPSFVSFSLVIIPYCTFSSISSGCIIFPIKYASLPLDRMPTVSSHNSAFLVFSFTVCTSDSIFHVFLVWVIIDHLFSLALKTESDNKYQNPMPRATRSATLHVGLFCVLPGHLQWSGSSMNRINP